MQKKLDKMKRKVVLGVSNNNSNIAQRQTQNRAIMKSFSHRSRRHRLYDNRSCWVSKLLLITIGTFIFIFLLNQNEYDKLSDTYLKKSNTNQDCYALDVLSPERISKLEKLNLNGCDINSIPNTIQYATNLKKLDVGNNPALTTLPDELASCKKLEILFVSSCPGIQKLPSVLNHMTSITRLGWRSGSLTSIDAGGIPPNLVHLILTDNNIQKMDDPELFDKLKYVRKLMLSHNQISKLGSSIHQLKSLELLRIAGNQLTSIPDELWQLPKLTWLTISGNPCVDKLTSIKTATTTPTTATTTATTATTTKVPWISPKDLKSTGESLGEGASGKVGSYIWNNEKVAVKIINGVTSDGRAEDELQIYGAVGSDGIEHRVVGCIALLKGDDNKKGAVMQQLPSNLQDLALPPTIIEVTQDRWDNWDDYDNGNVHHTFSASFVLNVISDTVNALKFLHKNIGVAHGDVYAHNMKVDKDTGRVYLLDFGASYFTGDEYREKAEKLEVRAFGVLINDLIMKLDPGEMILKEALYSLKGKCMDVRVHKRPSFDEIEVIIQSIPSLPHPTHDK
jgi:Leucine-rich repeat (LRR) protein